MTQYPQLDNPYWGTPLPSPRDRATTHQPRAELIHEVNPGYLSYWNPDGFGRALIFFVAALVGLIPSVCLSVNILTRIVRTGSVRLGDPIDAFDIGAIIFICSLPILAAIATYLTVRLPLRPPTYFNRSLRTVYSWHGNKKVNGGWMCIEWDKVVPVVRRTQIFHQSGSSTLYALHLLEVDPGSKAILKTIAAINPQRDPEICGEIWEYMRRYMNGLPNDLPPARTDWRMGGFWGLIIRLHETAFELWMRPDGSLRLGPISFFFAPAYVAVTYIYYAIALWLERVIPKREIPAELEQANRWLGTNPYSFHERSTEEQARLKRRAMQILPLSMVFMSISLVFNFSIVALMVWMNIS